MKTKKLATTIFILYPILFWGQQQIAPTEQFRIKGTVEKEQTVSLSDLKNFESHSLRT